MAVNAWEDVQTRMTSLLANADFSSSQRKVVYMNSSQKAVLVTDNTDLTQYPIGPIANEPEQNEACQIDMGPIVICLAGAAMALSRS